MVPDEPMPGERLLAALKEGAQSSDKEIKQTALRLLKSIRNFNGAEMVLEELVNMGRISFGNIDGVVRKAEQLVYLTNERDMARLLRQVGMQETAVTRELLRMVESSHDDFNPVMVKGFLDLTQKAPQRVAYPRDKEKLEREGYIRNYNKKQLIADLEEVSDDPLIAEILKVKDSLFWPTLVTVVKELILANRNDSDIPLGFLIKRLLTTQRGLTMMKNHFKEKNQVLVNLQRNLDGVEFDWIEASDEAEGSETVAELEIPEIPIESMSPDHIRLLIDTGKYRRVTEVIKKLTSPPTEEDVTQKYNELGGKDEKVTLGKDLIVKSLEREFKSKVKELFGPIVRDVGVYRSFAQALRAYENQDFSALVADAMVIKELDYGTELSQRVTFVYRDGKVFPVNGGARFDTGVARGRITYDVQVDRDFNGFDFRRRGRFNPFGRGNIEVSKTNNVVRPEESSIMNGYYYPIRNEEGAGRLVLPSGNVESIIQVAGLSYVLRSEDDILFLYQSPPLARTKCVDVVGNDYRLIQWGNSVALMKLSQNSFELQVVEPRTFN